MFFGCRYKPFPFCKEASRLNRKRLLQKSALLFSFVILFAFAVNTTFGFIIAKSNSIINTFAPFDSVKNHLLICKNIEHPFGDEYVLPDNLSFDFKVDLGPFYAKTTINTTNGDVIADESGSISVSVEPEQPFAIKGIDAGTKVTVTEILSDGSGFAVKDGCAVKEGIIAEDGSLNFEYINVYTPASVRPVNVFITGEKTLEGREWQEGDSFSFALEYMQGDGSWTLLGTKTVTFDAENGSFSHFDMSDLLHSLTFDRIGTYNFRIYEIEGDLENIDYDASVKPFAIKVTDLDMDGCLEIKSVTGEQNTDIPANNGKYSIHTTFNNTFISPSVPDNEEVPSAPSTGDESNKTGWLIVLIVSTCALIVCVIIKGRNKKTLRKDKA